MSVQRKGQYVLLSNDITLEDELSELDIPSPEPQASLHKRSVWGRTPGNVSHRGGRSKVFTNNRSRYDIERRSGRQSRTYMRVAMDAPGVRTRQFDGFNWTSPSGWEQNRNVEREETVKCIITSVLFIVVVVAVIIVAVVKNPEM